MKSYNVMCPVCGKINQNLNLEETNGWMECEHCQQTVQVSFAMDIALPGVTLTNVATCLQSHTLANAKTLSFTTLLEGGLENLREEMRYTVDFENDLYDIVTFKKSMSGNICFIEISCEHVSYRLNDKKLDMYSKTGTAKDVLIGLLEGTGFIAGSETLAREVTYSSQTSGTVRAVLLDFAGSFGYEVVFHRYTVSLVPHRGGSKGHQDTEWECSGNQQDH